MFSDDDCLYDEDSGNESPEDGIEDEEEDMDDDGEADDFGIDMEPGGSGVIRPGGSEEEFCFEVVSTEKIVSSMSAILKEVAAVVDQQIPPSTVRILLNCVRWDKERLMERLYTDDQEAFFAEAQVISPFTTAKVAVKRSSLKSKEECAICCCRFSRGSMRSLQCGHTYCCNCWTGYLTMKIMEEGASQMIECPGDCKIIVDDKMVIALLDDPRVRVKYQQLITDSFVQCNRLIRWCPSPDCSNAIKVQQAEAKLVTCDCGHSFCFGCAENWHEPVNCILIKKWLKKCEDDSETSNWLSTNTKECPKCGATIEKNGGCNNMKCKNQSCKADFCWVCLGPWAPHTTSWYNCNRFDDDEARSNRTNQETSRAALERYLFYCNRYMNHIQSLKFENKLYAVVKEKMEEMQLQSMSWIEVQFLKKALDTLCECRRTLMYTYAFAYYLKKNNQSAIFEDNQRDLETATEQLSEFLERDIDGENLADIKQKVQDKHRYCESRRKVLVAHVKEGYDKDWWLYIESY